MQSIVVYGRVVARAVVAGINNEFQYPLPWNQPSCSIQNSHRPFHLIAASAGISKTHSPARVSPKWAFGDDACFVAKHKVADVIGECGSVFTALFWLERVCPTNDPTP